MSNKWKNYPAPNDGLTRLYLDKTSNKFIKFIFIWGTEGETNWNFGVDFVSSEYYQTIYDPNYKQLSKSDCINAVLKYTEQKLLEIQLQLTEELNEINKISKLYGVN